MGRYGVGQADVGIGPYGFPPREPIPARDEGRWPSGTPAPAGVVRGPKGKKEVHCRWAMDFLRAWNYFTSSIIAVSAASPRRTPVRVMRV